MTEQEADDLLAQFATACMASGDGYSQESKRERARIDSEYMRLKALIRDNLVSRPPSSDERTPR